VRLYGEVYSSSGTEYTEAAPCVMPINMEMFIVDEFKASVSSPTVVLGKDANGNVTAGFMDSHTIDASKLQVDIGMLDNTSLPAEVTIEDAVLTLYHTLNSNEDYGGYSYASDADGNGIDDRVAPIVCKLKWDSKIKKYVSESAVTVQMAGTYYGVVSFNVKGSSQAAVVFSYENRSQTLLEVYSKKPTVAITAISPTGTFAADTTGNGSGHIDNVTVPAWNATNATVYFKCKKETYLWIYTTHNYTRPTVTITLADKGAASNATLSFGDSYVYSGNSRTGTFEWNDNGTCTRNIGQYSNRTGATDDKTAAGTITANTLVLTAGGQQYEFTVPTITINNPY